jgi:hypothetical protein
MLPYPSEVYASADVLSSASALLAAAWAFRHVSAGDPPAYGTTRM